MTVIPPFHLDFTVSTHVKEVETVDDESVEEARAAFIDDARYMIEKALAPIGFKIIDTDFIPDL